MRAIMVFAICGLALHAWGAEEVSEKLTINGKEYLNVRVQTVRDTDLILRHEHGLLKVKLEDLPEPLRAKYYDPQKIKAFRDAQAKAAADELEKAINAGTFREVEGVVYDTRKQAPGWTLFPNAKLLQRVEDGALIDPYPGQISLEVVFVKNLPNIAVISDTDHFSFSTKLVGTYTYLNKAGNERRVKLYDCGVPCRRTEIPKEILEGGKLFANAAPRTKPATVKRKLPAGELLTATGSGFFITEDGYLITNHHVVEDAHSLKVKTKAVTLSATVVKSDPKLDLALLKVSGTFKFLPVDITSTPGLGDPVFTIGFPNIEMQGLEPKYTDGKISSLAGLRDSPIQFQISVPVQPGNSGGPLVRPDGVVVGVIVAKLNDLAVLRASGSIPQNVNYAIKGAYIGSLLKTMPEVLTKVHLTRTQKPPEPIKWTEEAIAMLLVY